MIRVHFCCPIIFALISFGILSYAATNDDPNLPQISNPASLELHTQAVYKSFGNFSSLFNKEVVKELGFCIRNVDAEWNAAFNFSRDTTFLSSCIQRTKGDVVQRLCTSAEIKFYIRSFFEGGTGTNYLKPNKNCNLTSWVPGCEPGWACCVGKGKQVDLKNSKELPDRGVDCDTCCEGFFCPYGITCMIPCPLGSYCPLATLNKTTGVCDPYRYQLPPAHINHSCGGADVWADIMNSREIFCPPGFFCPSTITKRACESGHYFRTGSISQAEYGGIRRYLIIRDDETVPFIYLYAFNWPELYVTAQQISNVYYATTHETYVEGETSCGVAETYARGETSCGEAGGYEDHEFEPPEGHDEVDCNRLL